jgi:hypothetical protein
MFPAVGSFLNNGFPGRGSMKFRFMIAACIAAVLALPLLAEAQGIVRGAEEGAAEGNRAAGPVGGAVGAGLGGVVGGVEGGLDGVLGIPQRHGSTVARVRSDRAELTANQIAMTSLRARLGSKLICA